MTELLSEPWPEPKHLEPSLNSFPSSLLQIDQCFSNMNIWGKMLLHNKWPQKKPNMDREGEKKDEIMSVKIEQLLAGEYSEKHWRKSDNGTSN